MSTIAKRKRIVTDPSGGQWSWYLRSDGRYQVNSVEVPTYGFAMTAGALQHSCSESMHAVWRDIVLAGESRDDWS